MLQMVQHLRTGEVEVAELPDPRPGPGQVLVRSAWSVISPGTEQALARTAARSLAGKARERPDQVRQVVDKAVRDGVAATVAAVRARLDDVLTPGYSSAGIVEAVGAGVDSIKPGDRVGCVGANLACHAELVVVPAPLVFGLPAGLDLRSGAFGAIGAIAAHGVRVAEVQAGATVAVIGLGLVGQLAAQLATAAGARVVAIDLDRTRVDLAADLGAAAGAVLDGDVRAAVDGASRGRGADAVIVAAATKSSGPVELAGAIARDRAIVSVVGDVGLDVPRRAFFEKELQLRVSRSYGPGRYDPSYERDGHDYPIGYVRWTERRLVEYFFEEVAAGRLRLEPLITHEFAIEDGAEAYGALDDPARLAIVLRYRVDDPPAPRPAVSVTPAPAPGTRSGGRARPRVALIGPGLFARQTLLPLLAEQEVELAAVAGGTPAAAVATARRAGAAAAACSVDAVLDDPDVDVVVIATRHDSHAALAVRAMEAGKGVFLEKPAAIDADGLAALERALATGGRLVVDFNRGLSPHAGAVATHFSGRVDPLVVTCRVNAGQLPADHWLRDPGRGGGRLVGEGCHFVDLCGRLVGWPVVTVQVVAPGTGPRTLSGDSFVVTLTYADGSVATIAYAAAGSPQMAKERVEVIGGGRAAVIDDFRRHRLHGSRPRLPRLGRGSQDKGHRAMLERGLAFLAGGGTPPVPYERILETTRVTLVARDALTSGDAGPRSMSAHAR